MLTNPLPLLPLLLALLFTSLGHSAPITITDGKCHLQNHRLHLTLTTNINLPSDPLTALKSGLALYFYYQIEIEQTRPWLNHTTKHLYPIRLHYNPIAQTFVFNTANNPKTKSQPSLEQTLKTIGTLQSLSILTLDSNTTALRLKARFRLDPQQLPAALQISALSDSDWQLSSKWWTCQLTA